MSRAGRVRAERVSSYARARGYARVLILTQGCPRSLWAAMTHPMRVVEMCTAREGTRTPRCGANARAQMSETADNI